ncbi:hypothetical protein GQ457_18G010440 [Hibiscus cannabinus]
MPRVPILVLEYWYPYHNDHIFKAILQVSTDTQARVPIPRAADVYLMREINPPTARISSLTTQTLPNFLISQFTPSWPFHIRFIISTIEDPEKIQSSQVQAMTSTSNNYLYESQSITKPPFFNGDNYPYWKNRMRLFIKYNDYQREGDWLIPKVKMEMTDEDRRRMQVNDKDLHMLFCALGPNIYSKMLSCTIANEENKIGLLNLSYENFKIEHDENVTKMFNRYSVIMNGLKGLREVIPEDKLI